MFLSEVTIKELDVGVGPKFMNGWLPLKNVIPANAGIQTPSMIGRIIKVRDYGKTTLIQSIWAFHHITTIKSP